MLRGVPKLKGVQEVAGSNPAGPISCFFAYDMNCFMNHHSPGNAVSAFMVPLRSGSGGTLEERLFDRH